MTWFLFTMTVAGVTDIFFKGEIHMLIVFEGMDRSGKTTQIELLHKAIPNSIVVSEPGSTKLGLMLREFLKDKSNQIDKETEANLFLAARYDLYRKVVFPALEQGKTVISDRSCLSSLVYQDTTYVKDIHKDFMRLFNPDLVINLIIDEETFKSRAREDSEQDRFECREDISKLIEKYKNLGIRSGLPIHQIDATHTVGCVHALIMDLVKGVKR